MDSYVRFQSAVPNRHGRFPGVFALANGLARSGRLSAADRAWWQAANAEMDALYPDPATRDATVYDEARFPAAQAWFKAGPAPHVLGRARGYLDLLDRYRVPWIELRTASPGHVHYEDAVQVLATPYRHPDDWALD
jgi:hypothetical protein